MEIDRFVLFGERRCDADVAASAEKERERERETLEERGGRERVCVELTKLTRNTSSELHIIAAI